jgi:hypothetical protein
VVQAIVTSAQRAIADDKLPRAMALADRASALAPEDPAVTALVETVTEGGRASRRRRVIAAVGVATLLAGGAAAGVMLYDDGDRPQPQIAVLEAGVIDAAATTPFAEAAVAIDAAPLPVDARLVDAALARVNDAARPATPRDAPIVAMTADAPAFVVDAAIPQVVDAHVEQTGTLRVVNDSWCNVTIDEVPQGQIVKQKDFVVSAGSHVVKCKQNESAQWTQIVDVPANGKGTAQGTVLHPVSVSVLLPVTLDGVAYDRGAVIQLKQKRYQVVSGGVSGFVDITRDCRLRLDAGRFVCDP